MSQQTSRATGAGIAYMLLGIVLLPVMNAVAKSLTADYPLTQVVWARFLGHLVWMSLLFGPFLGAALLRARRPREMIGRSFVFLRLQLRVHRGTALHPARHRLRHHVHHPAGRGRAVGAAAEGAGRAVARRGGRRRVLRGARHHSPRNGCLPAGRGADAPLRHLLRRVSSYGRDASRATSVRRRSSSIPRSPAPSSCR